MLQMFQYLIVAIISSIITAIVVIKHADVIIYFIYEKLDKLDERED